MKNKLFVIGLMTMMFALSSTAQDKGAKSNNLDGKTYLVEMNMADGSKSTDHISFTNGIMESTECINYGFNKTKYKVSKDGNINATMKSNSEGLLKWNGKITEGVYSGTYLWVKEGQNDITVSFEGSEVKK